MERYLQQLPFWNDLSGAERETIRGCACLRRYAEGSLIYARDQECLGLTRVLRGAVRSVMLSEEGREIQLYRVCEGDYDVLSASCALNRIDFKTQIFADSDCELLIIPALCLAGIKQKNIYVRCFLYEKLGERFSGIMKRMEAMLFTRVDQRLAQVLLLRADETGRVRVTHEELAGEISSSREVVSRVLKQLETAGAVRLSRGSVTILSKAKLKELCKECISQQQTKE